MSTSYASLYDWFGNLPIHFTNRAGLIFEIEFLTQTCHWWQLKLWTSHCIDWHQGYVPSTDGAATSNYTIHIALLRISFLILDNIMIQKLQNKFEVPKQFPNPS